MMSTRLIEVLNQHISTSIALQQSKAEVEGQEFRVQNIKSILKNISNI